GDGAAVTWMAAATGGQGVLDVVCGTDGSRFDKFFIPAGGCRTPVSDAVRGQEETDNGDNVRSPAFIQMAGSDILSFVTSRIPHHVADFLKRNDLDLAAVDWLVFHQASSVVLDSLVALLDAEPTRVVRHLQCVGNTVSASIPMTLRSALDLGLLRPG